jgi:Ca2+:H+ antiporter
MFIATNKQVLIPIAGNAAEHGAAVIFAWRNEMDIVMGIALGSATQVAMFVLPVCVLLGWYEDAPMSLYFQPFECMCLLLTIIIVTFVITAAAGRSNWLVGLILISTCAVPPPHTHTPRTRARANPRTLIKLQHDSFC